MKALDRLRRTLDRMDPTKPARKRRPTPRERLAAHLLDAHGIDVDPAAISVPEGFYRTSYADCVERWNVRGTDRTGKAVEVSGLDSVTDCARYGVTLDPDADGCGVYGDFAAEAKRPPAEKGA